ncbi:hypothetical protein, partial [Novosphingobium sp. BK256]|uniref:hypothetical protein n=1 Tax=Novosphingobium sp. BK256 TaxID=2587100 RepID=UPI001C842CF1
MIKPRSASCGVFSFLFAQSEREGRRKRRITTVILPACFASAMVKCRKISRQNAHDTGVLRSVCAPVEKWPLTVWAVLHICRFTDAVQPVFPAAWL